MMFAEEARDQASSSARERGDGWAYERLDVQMKVFAARLIADVGLREDETGKVATTIAAETRWLDAPSRARVLAASPVPIEARLAELRAFQAWMDLATGVGDPAVVRAQVIIQNYVCFVYLSEACFRALRKVSSVASVTHRCCQFLDDNPVRAFRNAIAHSNWMYAGDFSGLVFWARKGNDTGEAPSRFDLSQEQLTFWQALEVRGVRRIYESGGGRGRRTNALSGTTLWGRGSTEPSPGKSPLNTPRRTRPR